MPENEFERKVSSEMQELRFKPSEKVWLQVEERIREKKKRRVFIILLFFAGLALLGYWQRNNLFGEKGTGIINLEKQNEENAIPKKESGNSSPNDPNTGTTKQQETRNETDKAGTENLPVVEPGLDKKNTGNTKNDIQKLKSTTKKETSVNPAPEKTKIKDGLVVATHKVTAPPQKQNLVVANDKTKDTALLNESKEIVNEDEIKQAEIKPVDNKIDSTKTGVIEQKKNIMATDDSLLKRKAKDSAAAIVQKNASEKKWKWGLHLTPGISALNGNSISLGSSRSADANYYQSPSGSPTGGPPVRQEPSEVRSGFAFQAGTFAQRELSPRTIISLGLQYGYYSTHISIGNKRASSTPNNQTASVSFANNNVYNAGGDTIKYTNQYHFIELPFNFHWQLNKNKTKPFIWSTGFTMGQLIANNALMYDTAFNGVYYKNKSQLNKTQFSLSTGFSWTIANNQQAQWSIGPVVNIHLNKLFESPFENKKYLFFAGVRANVLFNQKK